MRKPPVWSAAWPEPFAPQQSIVFCVVNPHVCADPAATDVKVTPTGTETWPDAEDPTQVTALAVVTPHV